MGTVEVGKVSLSNRLSQFSSVNAFNVSSFGMVAMNIWIVNRQLQGQQINRFPWDVTDWCKLCRNRYNHITSCLTFMSKGRQLPQEPSPIYKCFCLFYQIYSGSQETAPFWWQRISMRLLVGSALCCGLITDPYIHLYRLVSRLRVVLKSLFWHQVALPCTDSVNQMSFLITRDRLSIAAHHHIINSTRNGEFHQFSTL